MNSNKLLYALKLLRTRLLWGWRFGALGKRVVLGRCRFALNPRTVLVGDHSHIRDGWAFADLSPQVGSRAKIRIGRWCSIQHDFQCNANLGVEIGDYTLIAPRVFVTDSDHIVDSITDQTSKWNDFRSKPVIIGSNCWLGVNVVVLKGVTIGDNCIIGANAVVTHDVDSGSIVAGNPAKIVGRTGAHGSASILSQ